VINAEQAQIHVNMRLFGEGVSRGR
jgi:hypothetical protein